MTKILIDYAPYLASIIAGIVAYLSFIESKRKTKHDELHDLYDEIKNDNDKVREERDDYHQRWLDSEKKIDELKEKNHE